MNSTSNSEYWTAISNMLQFPQSKKALKLIEFWILQQLSSQPVSTINCYVEFSIQTGKIKYMDRARDLIERQLSLAMTSNNQEQVL